MTPAIAGAINERSIASDVTNFCPGVNGPANCHWPGGSHSDTVQVRWRNAATAYGPPGERAVCLLQGFRLTPGVFV